MRAYPNLPASPRRVAARNPPQPKADAEKAITREQCEALLKAVEAQDGMMRHRDHALFFLAYYLGLRVGEAVLLKRSHLRLDQGTVMVPTLKCQPKAAFQCSACHRKLHLRLRQTEAEHRCLCGAVSTVPAAKDVQVKAFTEREPAFVEAHVVEYLRRLDANLPRGQTWLFASERGNGHLSRRRASWLFKYYARLAGLPHRMSFHSLRHGRGMAVWSASHDQQLVRQQLRHTSLKSSEVYVHLSPERLAAYKAEMEKGRPAHES